MRLRIRRGPGPDPLATATAVFVQSCQQSATGFVVYLSDLQEMIGNSEIGLEIRGVTKLLDTEAVVVAGITVNGASELGLVRSLFVFENGEWLMGGC